MKRRSFLRRASVLPLPFLLGQAKLSAVTQPWLAGEMADDDRVLVLLQLRGGNDGLNTVIPLDQYRGLQAARGNLVIPPARVLAVEDTVGFHPAMAGMRSMYDDGQVSVVQGVGYPEQNRSHFRSTDILNTASDSDEVLTTGWLGRHLDARQPGYPEGYPSDQEPDPFAIVMGDSVSETCQGTSGNFSIALAGLDGIGQLPVFAGGPALDSPYGRELDWLRTTISQSNQYAVGIQRAADDGSNLGAYPNDNATAAKLRDVAKLISGGLRTRIYIVELGGFDTHAGQVESGDTTVGTHADLLGELSDAIAAFQADLMQLGIQRRVLGMTYSEFGRRIKSNDSEGSDHGDSAPLFLFGACVNGGVTGENVEIPTDIGGGEGVPMQYDFRNVYGSVLMDWFGVADESVRQLLTDDFAYIPLVRDCRSTSVSDSGLLKDSPKLSVSPNPAGELARVSFVTGNQRARLSLFDTYGRRVRLITDKDFMAGTQSLEVSLSGLPSGVYFVHLMMAGGVRRSVRLVKR